MRDRGWTLIELMVVILIIAIMIAIAIPTFLGARARAQYRGCMDGKSEMCVSRCENKYEEDGKQRKEACAKAGRSDWRQTPEPTDPPDRSYCDEHGNRVYTNEAGDIIAVVGENC